MDENKNCRCFCNARQPRGEVPEVNIAYQYISNFHLLCWSIYTQYGLREQVRKPLGPNGNRAYSIHHHTLCLVILYRMIFMSHPSRRSSPRLPELELPGHQIMFLSCLVPMHSEHF